MKIHYVSSDFFMSEIRFIELYKVSHKYKIRSKENDNLLNW